MFASTSRGIVVGLLIALLASGAWAQGQVASRPPQGAAGGDLSGTFPNPTVGKIGGVAVGTYATVSAAPLRNVLASPVTMTTASTYYDGPTVAQGTVGTWWAGGNVMVSGTAGDQVFCKLWDGTTQFAAAYGNIPSGLSKIAFTLAGWITSPAGNIRISCADATTSTTPSIVAGFASNNNSTISAFRIPGT